MKKIVQIIALVLAVGAGLYLLFAPSYRTEMSDSAGDVYSGTTTILENAGIWAIVLAAIPLAIAVSPLVVPPRAWQAVTIVATVLLAIWGVAGMWSIGGYYAPAVLCLFISIFIPHRRAARYT
ncbi:hypothetical protein GCM10027416_10900 [Okibacterium endophyticum]